MKDIIPEIRDCSTLLSHFERWQNSNRIILSKAKFYNFSNHYFQNNLESNKNILLIGMSIDKFSHVYKKNKLSNNNI